jgi:hypothetical protein
MACNDCYSLEQIPECTESQVLGTIDPDTEVYIYVKNVFSGYVHRQEATSNETGELTLNLTLPEASFYNQDSQYQVWATLRDDNERIDITYAYGLTATCLNLSFFKYVEVNK